MYMIHRSTATVLYCIQTPDKLLVILVQELPGTICQVTPILPHWLVQVSPILVSPVTLVLMVPAHSMLVQQRPSLIKPTQARLSQWPQEWPTVLFQPERTVACLAPMVALEILIPICTLMDQTLNYIIVPMALEGLATIYQQHICSGLLSRLRIPQAVQ